MPTLLWVPLADRGVLAITGDDAKPFLQGLISNDIAKLNERQALYAALLSPQGKYLHDFFLAEHGGAILLDGEGPRLDDLRRRLSTYRLRSRVVIEPRPELAVAALLGTDVAAALGVPPEEPGAARPLGGGIAFLDPRLVAMGGRVILPRAHAAAVLTQLDGATGEHADYERRRLALGLPEGSRDLRVDKALLLESGFEELNGVDWRKGCYVGQEVTARTKYRGLIKRRLVPLKAEGPLPPPDTPIVVDGRVVGETRSGQGEIVLALLSLDSLRATLATGGAYRIGETMLRPFLPPWLALPGSETTASPTAGA